MIPCYPAVPVHGAGSRKKNQGLVFRRRSSAATAHAAAAASNPGDWVFVAAAPDAVVAGTAVPPAGSCIRPVENSLVMPAVIVTGVERSWYPSRFRSTVWLPAGRPGMVAGLTPRWTPSMKTDAPAGVVVTDRDPLPAGTTVLLLVATLVRTVTGAVVVVEVGADVAAAVVVVVTAVVAVDVTVVVGTVVVAVVMVVSVAST